MLLLRTRRLIVAVVLTATVTFARAETLVEHSAETQFQLDVHAPDAVISGFLPQGWSLNVATQGNAKDANLRVVFIDRLTINAPDGKPASKGSNRLVYMIVPVKDASGTASQLVIGGLTEDTAEAPGPFGVYLPAATHSMQRSVSNASGAVIESQDWVFSAASGEHLELHVKFERGVANRAAPADTRFYSAKSPNFYQISRQDRVLDVVRNATTNPPDRVKEFSFKASGGSYAKIFDGTEKLLSWDHIIWVNRDVLLP
jgi:hypothetical protein